VKSILLTGATGALGSALLPLLAEGPDSHVHLLLRARDPGHLQDRLTGLLAYAGLSADTGRITAHAGDVCEDHLGLDPSLYTRLTGEVTHVVHAAGDVHLDRPLAEARRVAVRSVEEILAFCRGSAALVKLDHLSTVGVAGRTSGLVPEAPLSWPRAFHNTYEQAKAEAEDLVLEAMSRGLPATIHRPSMVVGDARTGRAVRFQVFHHLGQFLAGMRTGGLVPDAGAVRLDIVPSDWVARALVTSMTHPESTGRILHLCSGPTQALSANEMGERLRVFYARHEGPLPPLQRAPLPDFLAALPALEREAGPSDRRFLAGLPHLLAYFGEIQIFDDEKTRAFLGERGVVTPSVESYLGAQVDYFCRARRDLRDRRER